MQGLEELKTKLSDDKASFAYVRVVSLDMPRYTPHLLQRNESSSK